MWAANLGADLVVDRFNIEQHRRATKRLAQRPATLDGMSRRNHQTTGPMFIRRGGEYRDPDGHLAAALGALCMAVGELTAQRTARIQDRPVTAPCLVDQLAEALAWQQGTGRGGAARSLPLVWVDAADLLNGIDVALSAWDRGLPPARIPLDPTPTTTADHLRALTGRAWRPQDLARIEKLTAALTEWTTAIEALLDPPSRMYLSAPCPVCGESFTHPTDRAGEQVRVPVLTVDAMNGAECLAREAFWAPTLFGYLSTVLDE